MENHRLTRGAIFILLSSILYNASGNKQQTQLLNLEENVLDLQAECVSIRKDLRLERIDRQNMIDLLNQTLYQCTGDCKGTRVKEKAPHVLNESMGKASDASDCNASYYIQVLRRSFTAEKVKRRELENKLADTEHKYATLVNTVNTFEEKIRRLPKHDYDVALSKLRDVGTKLESKVGVLEKKFAELTSKVENLTRFEDKHSAGIKVQSFTGSPALVHKEIDPLTSQSDSSCHVKNHCTNPQFPADPCAVILSRAEWGARVSRSVRLMNKTVSIVFIHHTETPRCVFTSICSKEVKKIQNYHMDTKEQLLSDSNDLDNQMDYTCHVTDHCKRRPFLARPCAVILSRADWEARDTRSVSYMKQTVSTIFIHHTAMTRCFTSQECILEMKKIQDLHMDTNGWDDIGYSFLVGDNGMAYEARGWNRVGAHTRGWNSVSISIAVMGNFNEVLPSDAALNAIDSLISCGINTSNILTNYTLYGHRAASQQFDSPGHMLNDLIQTWPHHAHISARA